MGKMSEVMRRSGRDLNLTRQPAGQPGQGGPAGAPGQPGRKVVMPAPAPGGLDPRLAEENRLFSYFAPGSPEAKRIDILRSQLLFPFHGEPPRTIMITSAAPQEGRSLLTTNLAISFARGLQQFVMIMDCHLTDPAIHQLLQVPRHPGLTDFLERGASVPSIIHRTPVEKLTVIPAGNPSQRPAEILSTDKMAGLVTELRARYRDRFILLDTPPIQAFDDPQVLARLVEAIIFVVLTGETDRELVLRSLRALPEEKIIGVVLNDAENCVVDATAVGGGSEMEV